MTAIIYFGEMLVASLLAIVLLAISQLRMSSDAVLFAGGVVALTLAEYVVHRFVLHGFAPTEHRLHHANPDDAVLTIFWQIWICFALVYLIVGGAFVAGAQSPMPGICSCITARITVQTVCRCHFLSIIKAITDLRPETTASAPHFGTMSSGRCCDDDVGAVASI
jgi:hypothetical protein